MRFFQFLCAKFSCLVFLARQKEPTANTLNKLIPEGCLLFNSGNNLHSYVLFLPLSRKGPQYSSVEGYQCRPWELVGPGGDGTAAPVEIQTHSSAKQTRAGPHQPQLVWFSGHLNGKVIPY